ncbi:hypothetical protein [Acidovorax sp. Root217]|uniref:hypothetical protein n=1 Tax=Acidovorax sp. Root217 TaxID=1736492 RepID=UPI00070D03FD|nr:hypothetical protein [Acidovorax sp. Root217]KRC30670.1 hypothetical protein ASE31_00335 [Acidovorax sp. Root217]
MPDISPQTDGPIYADDEAPPSWQDLRDDGAVLIDTPDQKLAVYAGDLSAVVLVSQELDDPLPRFIPMEHTLIPELVAKLTKVQSEAAAISAEWEAKYEAVENDPHCSAEAEALAKGTMSNWLAGAHTPCDPETFIAVLEVWQEGREKPLAGPEPGAPGVYLMDMPMNRSAMAAVAFMREKGIANSQAYLWRCMHLGDIFNAVREHGLSDLVRENEVHTALLKAAAVAKLNDISTDGGGFDMDDVARLAREFMASEDAGTK